MAINKLINYTTKHGANLYKQGTKALGTPFSMKASKVVILCNVELEHQVFHFHWPVILEQQLF